MASRSGWSFEQKVRLGFASILAFAGVVSLASYFVTRSLFVAATAVVCMALVGAVAFFVGRTLTRLYQESRTELAERCAAEERLRVSNERYRLVSRAVNDAIWDWNLVTGKVRWNDGLERLFGYTMAECCGVAEFWKERIHPEDRDRVLGELDQLIERGGDRWSGEYRFRCKDGRYSYVVDRAYAIHDTRGKISRMVGAMIDLTERRRAEESILRSNAELEQFAFVASHDLKEPLRTVTNYVQLLGRKLDGKLDGDTAQDLKFIADGTKRMYGLITDLLEYSRAGRKDAPLRHTDCRAVLQTVLEGLNEIIHSSGAEISHGELPMLLADSTQFAQLLQNLVSNSIKYRSDRRPRIHIDARWKENEYVFSVTDNGIGLDPRFRERIFEVFQRLHARDVYSGTGIGLSICKRIVTRHGGRIWVESVPGAGATFFFTIPQPAA